MTILTERETLILSLVQQGLTNYQIAVRAQINPTMLQAYLRIIKDKLGVDSKEELIQLKVQQA